MQLHLPNQDKTENRQKKMAYKIKVIACIYIQDDENTGKPVQDHLRKKFL